MRDHGPVDAGGPLTFGRWPAASDPDEASPIEWLTLEDDAIGGALLVSRLILDCQRYNETLEETTWSASSLRRWLNETFLRQAFTTAERERILLTHCADNGPGTPATSDRVFLLSVGEVRALTHAGTGVGIDRRATATAYAAAPRSDGRRLYVYDKGVEADYLTVDGSRRGCSWWWTRSQPKAQGGSASTAAFVGPRGDVKSYGKVNLARYGVRPAIRVSSRGSVAQA